MQNKHILLIFLLPILISACNATKIDVTPLSTITATYTQKFELTLTNTQTITNTPFDKPISTITPTIINKLKVHSLAMNEQNAQIKVKKLSTFGEPRNSCLLSSDLNNAVGIRTVNGKTQYLLVIGSLETRDIQVWDLEAKKILHTLKNEGSWSANSFAFHPDQQKLISITPDESTTLTIWDIQSGKIIQELKFDVGRYAPITISPDGLDLALFTVYGEADVRVSELNLQTNEIRDAEYKFPLFWETEPPYVYTSQSDLLSITYARDEKLHLLNLSNNGDTELQFPFASLDEADRAEAIVSTMAINSNRTYIAGGAKNGYIYIWDALNGKLIQTLMAHKTSRTDGWLGGIKILEFSPESNLLVSVGYDGFTKLWNAKTGALLQQLNVCYFGGFTSDGRYLATIGKDGIQLWGIP